jgi:hypothetical protein
MTTTKRRRRSKKRFYWAEIGFLLLGLIGLKPEIVTSFLPQSRHTTVPTSYEWPQGSHMAYSNDAANQHYATSQPAMQPNAAQASGVNPNGWLMQPNGNEWGNGSQFASYHPATATQAIPASAHSQWSQVTSTKPDSVSQAWSTSSTSSTSPPVVWPDKWGPNGVSVSPANTIPQQTTSQYALQQQYITPQYNVANLPQPFNAPTATSYYGQTQSSMPTNGWPTNPSPSTSPNTATAWNGQPQPVLVPMQQRPPQWASANVAIPTVANPAMSVSGGAAMAASNPYGAPYASTPYASPSLTTYPVAAGSNPAMRVPGTVTYPGATTAVGAPNPWNQYGVPAGSNLGRY